MDQTLKENLFNSNKISSIQLILHGEIEVSDLNYLIIHSKRTELRVLPKSLRRKYVLFFFFLLFILKPKTVKSTEIAF